MHKPKYCDAQGFIINQHQIHSSLKGEIPEKNVSKDPSMDKKKPNFEFWKTFVL